MSKQYGVNTTIGDSSGSERHPVDYALLQERFDRIVAEKQWLTLLSTAVKSECNLNDLMRVVRDVFVEEFGFDRAGVFSYDDVTDTMRGSWGTDSRGEPEDNTHFQLPFQGPERDTWEQVKQGGAGYFLRHYEPDQVRYDLPEEMSTVSDRASILLSVGTELVGYIALDNLLSQRPITESRIEELIPFTRQAATFIQNAKLREDRETATNRQKRINEISLAITSNEDPDTVFLLVRNAIVEIGMVDRASVWIFGEREAHGTWGTDDSGLPQDEHHLSFAIDRGSEDFSTFSVVDSPFVINTVELDDPKGDGKIEVPHAFAPLRINGELIGLVAVDTLLTRRRITPAMMSAVIPITDQAAVAIQKSKILEQRESLVRMQKHTMEIAAAIAESNDLDAVCRLVRDSVLDTGCADRAGVWLIDGHNSIGTWGTDEQGNLKDEHEESYSIEQFVLKHPKFMLGEVPFLLFENHAFKLSTGETESGLTYAIIPLRAGSNLLGMITLDNLITKKQVSAESIELILPLAKQAAIALLNSKLRMEREAVIKHQKRLLEISVAITAYQETDSVFRMVRDAIMEIGFFDRAGVWLVDGDTVWGTWGSDNNGQTTDEHGHNFSLTEHLSEFSRCIEGQEPFLIDVLHSESLPSGEVRRNIPHALIPLKAGDQLMGVLAVDTLLTMRKITAEMLSMILPLAELAAVVIMKRRLLKAAQTEIERRSEVEGLLIGQTRELIKARDAALAGERSKSQFLANMSHEIRTPMNGVIGLTSLLLLTPLSQKQRDYATGVEKSAESLLSIIDDILDFSRLEAGKLRIASDPFNLRDCIRSVVELMASTMMKEAVLLHCSLAEDLPDWVVGDGDRVRQIVTNLLANAIKFTHQGEIAVSGTCLSQSLNETAVRIEVRDTGIGIAKEKQEAVFESFTQADGSLTRRHNGAGLGLTITKQIAELMGGSIKLKSSPGEGTCVWLDVTFRKQQTSQGSNRTDSSDQDAALELKVLLAEDNPINATVATARLENWGCECVAVENGIEALKILQSQKVDVVLMDVSMPEMDGIEATKELRRIEETTGNHVPVIAITAHAMEGDRERCLAAGMDDYLAKPVDFNELLRKLRNLGRHIVR